MFILRLASSLEKARIPYAIVGGYAVALHGAVRGTVDVDLVLQLKKEHWLAIEILLKGLGLESRLPLKAEEVFHFREQYVRDRNLVAWNFYNPKRPIECVDILLTEDLKGMKVEKVAVGQAVLRIASVEDLIRMKLKSGRTQDLADVDALRRLKR